MEMPLVLPGYDINDAHARRSYAARFITSEVNKVINLPVLKDHSSAGVTLCLKNLSHGLVNNVSRSHLSPTANACGVFIPAVVSMPVIRDKVVLNILDGIKACTTPARAGIRNSSGSTARSTSGLIRWPWTTSG